MTKAQRRKLNDVEVRAANYFGVSNLELHAPPKRNLDHVLYYVRAAVEVIAFELGVDPQKSSAHICRSSYIDAEGSRFVDLMTYVRKDLI